MLTHGICDLSLHQSEESTGALWADGVGWIAQYDSWYMMQWEKGIPYFARDYRLWQLESVLQQPESAERTQRVAGRPTRWRSAAKVRRERGRQRRSEA